MPIAKIQMPDGRIARFEVPEGTTEEQVIKFANSSEFGAKDNPPNDAAKKPEPEIRVPNPQPTNVTAPSGDGSGTLHNLITGDDRSTELTDRLPELHESGLLAGENLAKSAAISPALLSSTNPQEIADIITSSFPNVGVTYNKDAKGGVFPVLVNNKTGAATVINKPGISGLDVMQGLGIAAAFTPAGKAPKILGAIGKSAATEAALQGTQALSGGEFNKLDVALAGGLGGAAKGAENVLGTAFRMAKGSGSNSLVNSADNVEIPILTSDVLSPETFAAKALQQTGEKLPFIGTGQLRAAQQKFREKAVDRVADKYGEASYDIIIQSLKGKSDATKRAAGRVLQATGETLDDVGQVSTAKTIKAIEEAKTGLNKPGVVKTEAEEKAIKELDTFMNTLLSSPQIFSSLKQNRTAFNNIVEGLDKADRSQLTSNAKRLMTNVRAGMTDDMKGFASSNLTPQRFSKWEKANKVWAGEANNLTKSKLKNILDKGDVRPEVVDTMLFSRNQSELSSLFKSLGPEGRSNARMAIINRAFDNIGRRTSGVTPNAFNTELKKLNKQVGTFFRGEEKKMMEGLSRVLSATSRAQEASATTPTGLALFLPGAGLAATVDPLSTAAAGLTLAGMARTYESAPVRSALLRLASVPKGSTAFESALSDVQVAMSASAQSARSQEQEER